MNSEEDTNQNIIGSEDNFSPSFEEESKYDGFRQVTVNLDTPKQSKSRITSVRESWRIEEPGTKDVYLSESGSESGIESGSYQ